MEADSPTALFCRSVRARSEEHREALRLLVPAGLASVVVGLLRQEVDSLVRVLFLLHVGHDERDRLLEAFVAGRRWTVHTSNEKERSVTDREMVNAVDHLHGWAGSVYRFGCAFIHLSEFHDHGVLDPVNRLAPSERENLLRHLRAYHNGPAGDRPTVSDILPMLPAVLAKISTNLESHLKDLERGDAR